MQQVHGNNIVRVSAKDGGGTIPDCDALITNDPKVELVVKTADCLPISVRDKETGAIGLIHAGWRGLEKEIIAKTIKLMIKEFFSKPENLTIYIGPHICQKHYEVKEDVAGKFVKYKPLVTRRGKKYLDLAGVAVFQLIRLGAKKENITIDKRCTFEDKNLFSYRRGDRAKYLELRVSHASEYISF